MNELEAIVSTKFSHKALLGTGKSRVVLKIWGSNGIRTEVDYRVKDEVGAKTFQTLVGKESEPASLNEQGGDAPDWKRFALAVLINARDSIGSDVDGGLIQDIATECGLLVKVEATGACDEHACACVEYGFPVDCYRYTPGTLAAIAAVAASAAKGEQTI